MKGYFANISGLKMNFERIFIDPPDLEHPPPPCDKTWLILAISIPSGR